jgi:hypothetical protein
MTTYLGTGCIDPRILNLGSRWRVVVIYTPRSLFSEVKPPLSVVYEDPWVPEQTKNVENDQKI